MFTLIKVPNTIAKKGLYHTRQNGRFVEELFKKDADCIYEEKRIGSGEYGKKFDYFIVNYNKGDKLRCGDRNFLPPKSRRSHSLDSYEMSKMCKELIEQGKPLPKKLNNLIAEHLPNVFENIWCTGTSRGFTSATIWEDYAWILKYMGKDANEFVKQDKIDLFFLQLCNKQDILLISQMLEDGTINVSEDVLVEIAKVKKNVAATIEIVKAAIQRKQYEWVTPFRAVLKIIDTPCGCVDLLITFEGGYFVRLYGEINPMDITNQCYEFKKELLKDSEKFYRKRKQ